METATSDTFMSHIRRKMAAALHSGGRKERTSFRSSSYWDKRYENGNNSGPGSYGRLALFKAKVINQFVKERDVRSVIEFGCGDGSQLKLADYPDYIGIDVSPRATALCRKIFAGDPHKNFLNLAGPESKAARAEMALSLDVIYHLIEDEVFEDYMESLVRAATKFICVYSSNIELPGHVPHIRHRHFTNWLAKNAPDWTLSAFVGNEYPYDVNDPTDTSWADFYFFERGRGGIIVPFVASLSKAEASTSADL